jgi:hypothetical protein
VRIIDTHCHFGVSNLSGWSVREADLLAALEAHGVSMALVMPHAVTDDPVAAHDQVADLCRRHPTRFRGVVNLSPVQAEAAYRREATRCVRALGFVALKLNPMQHLASPVMANADKVFVAAEELAVPVIVHTGIGAPWALPSLCIPPARRHPTLPIVLAHAGYAIYAEEALVAAQECPNIYLEPSWCTVTDVGKFLRAIGADRIMFGSDHPDNIPVELAKYRSLRLREDEMAACLGGTAARLYRLDG